MKEGDSKRRAFFLLLGPAASVAMGAITASAGLPPVAWKTAAITTLCAVWWVTEPIALAATALIPFALLPLAGVLDHHAVASAYGNHIVLLLLSGFILSRLLEESGVHRRLAGIMVRIVGGRSHRRLVLAFMLTSAALSMWIANTAVALMMLPIIAAVYRRDEHAELAVPLLLGVCYATNIGGLGTPIGTPPNPVFMAAYEEATGKTVSFVDWMSFGVPTVLILVPVAWLIVTRNLRKGTPIVLERSGLWSQREVIVLVLFGLTALSWVTREGPWGGWSHWLGMVDAEGDSYPGDSTVGLFFVVLAFFIPDGKGSRILEWKTVEQIPWGLLVLVGGGVAIARAFSVSGLSGSIGSSLVAAADWPLFVMVLVLCLGVSFMTELTSNTATSTLLMPILAAAAIGVGVDPGMLMIPAVLSCACAFMLPVATGPNAIVYGSGRIPISRMVGEGIRLNMIAVVIVSVICMGMLPEILERSVRAWTP